MVIRCSTDSVSRGLRVTNILCKLKKTDISSKINHLPFFYILVSLYRALYHVQVSIKKSYHVQVSVKKSYHVQVSVKKSYHTQVSVKKI